MIVYCTCQDNPNCFKCGGNGYLKIVPDDGVTPLPPQEVPVPSEPSRSKPPGMLVRYVVVTRQIAEANGWLKPDASESPAALYEATLRIAAADPDVGTELVLLSIKRARALNPMPPPVIVVRGRQNKSKRKGARRTETLTRKQAETNGWVRRAVGANPFELLRVELQEEKRHGMPTRVRVLSVVVIGSHRSSRQRTAPGPGETALGKPNVFTKRKRKHKPRGRSDDAPAITNALAAAILQSGLGLHPEQRPTEFDATRDNVAIREGGRFGSHPSHDSFDDE